MISFEKVMTREVPLTMVEAWSAAFIESIPRIFGFPWPAPLFISRNGVVESWRPTKLFHEMLPGKVAKWLRLPRNQHRLFRTFVNYERYARQIRRMRLPKTIKSQRLIQEIGNIMRAFSGGCSGLIPAFWLAEWNNRAVTSDRGPLFDADILTKAQQIRKEDTFMDDCTELIYLRLHHIARQEFRPDTLINSMRFVELQQLVNKKENTKKLMKLMKRRLGYVYFQRKIVLLDAFPAFLRTHHYRLNESYTPRITRLTGMIAHHGMASGIVKVVHKRTELPKVQRGNILVAPMTTPWYLPAMQKASAFVTDEGGITSHAAIVARELKKPCIIGTKIATKVFKDGDEVEVDAVKGVVRKIQ